MPFRSTEQEVDTHTVRWMIGAIAFALPTVLIVAWLAHALPELPTSISESYILADQWPRDVFVGAMFALASLLLSYNGGDNWDFAASKVACLGAVILATHRCECDGLFTDRLPLPYPASTHAIGTLAVIVVLLYFCVIFFRRARAKLRTAIANGQVEEAKFIQRRMSAYAAAFLLQAGAVVPFLMHRYAEDPQLNHGVFWAEAMTLYAFALCWYTSARTNALLEHKSLRKKLFRP